jgi:carbohydrate-selective porin OprB
MVDVLGSPTLGNKFAARVAGNLMLTSAAACAAGIYSASVVFGMDIVTKSEQPSQNSPVMQSSQSTEQQSSVFGDWGGLRSWLSSRGIDLGASYLSESAWNVAGGRALGGTYAGQENVSLDINWEKIASIKAFRRISTLSAVRAAATSAVGYPFRKWLRHRGAFISVSQFREPETVLRQFWEARLPP